MRRVSFAALLAAVVAGGLLWWSRGTPPAAPPTVPLQQPAANAPVARPPAATRDLTIFLARQTPNAETGQWVLVPVRRTADPSAPRDRASLEALVKGPTAREKSDGIVATLPEGTRLLGVQKEDHVAAASFSRELQEKFSGGADWEEVVLYSIVNTLSEVEGTDAVRIRIEGAPVESIGGHLAADEPLRRNSEIVGRREARR